MRAIERTDERVAQYYSLYSWLLSTIVSTCSVISLHDALDERESDIGVDLFGGGSHAINAVESEGFRRRLFVHRIHDGDLKTAPGMGRRSRRGKMTPGMTPEKREDDAGEKER